MPQTKAQERRAQLGLTLRALAEECAKRGAPVDNSQLNRIERGLMTPRPKLRATLADILGIEVNDLGRTRAVAR